MHCVASIYQVFLPSIRILRELMELSNGKKQRKNCGSERSIIAYALVSSFEFENFVLKYLDYQRGYERLEIEIPIISIDYSLISRCTLVF